MKSNFKHHIFSSHHKMRKLYEALKKREKKTTTNELTLIRGDNAL